MAVETSIYTFVSAVCVCGKSFQYWKSPSVKATNVTMKTKSSLSSICLLAFQAAPSYGQITFQLILVLATTFSLQAQYNYTILNVPGAVETLALGVSGDEVVGESRWTSSGPYGFLYDGSSYTTLSVPGAPETIALGVSGNEIVGFYNSLGNTYGFVYNISNQTYTTLSVPGAQGSTVATGISGNNIVGYYWDGTANQGFLYDDNDGSYTTLSIPAEQQTWAIGVSGNDIMVDTGFYAGRTFLYNINGQTYTGLPFLGVSISGDYILTSSEVYNLKKQTYTALNLNVPEAESTTASGISGHDIVGWFVNISGLDEGFLATPVPVSPTIACPAPLVLECENGAAVGTVQVIVQESNDVPVQVVWTLDDVPYQTNNIPAGGAIASTNLTLTATFGTGEHVVGVSASNGQSAPATCSTTVTVSDTLPPQILSIEATPNVLWPPNKRMIPVNLIVDAVDNCDPSPVATITQVTSNEPENPSAPDWEITGPLSVNLRADRLGMGQARIYKIQVQCEDSSGNISFASVNVAVPHDKK
jgi:hypothetical protein